MESQESLLGKERGQGVRGAVTRKAEVCALWLLPWTRSQELARGCMERVPRVSGGMRSCQHLACSLGKLSLVFCPLDLSGKSVWF